MTTPTLPRSASVQVLEYAYHKRELARRDRADKDVDKLMTVLSHKYGAGEAWCAVIRYVTCMLIQAPQAWIIRMSCRRLTSAVLQSTWKGLTARKRLP